MLLTKDQYRELSGNWAKYGTIYQEYGRYQVRFPTLLKHINVFKGKNVLEVGCNAGLAAYHIAQVANCYTGVEQEKGYWQQALETKKHIPELEHEPTFLNMSIKSFMKRIKNGELKDETDAAYLSYVLYHFSDKEVRMFEKMILPKLDVIIVQSRFAERNKKGRKKHNSYAFWHPMNVEKYLNKNGFSTTVEWGPERKFHFIIGSKDISDEKLLKEEDNMIHEALIEPKGEAATYTKEIEEALIKNRAEPIVEKEWYGYVTDDNGDSYYCGKDGEIYKRLYGSREFIPISIEDKPTWIQFDKFDKEKIDGDKGDSGIHSESACTVPEGRSASGGSEQPDKGEPCDTVGREVDSEGKSETVLSEKPESGHSGVLQPVVEKSTEETVRDKDIQKVEKTPRTRRRSTTGKNSGSRSKPVVQKDVPQNDGVGDKDATC